MFPAFHPPLMFNLHRSVRYRSVCVSARPALRLHRLHASCCLSPHSGCIRPTGLRLSFRYPWQQTLPQASSLREWADQVVSTSFTRKAASGLLAFVTATALSTAVFGALAPPPAVRIGVSLVAAAFGGSALCQALTRTFASVFSTHITPLRNLAVASGWLAPKVASPSPSPQFLAGMAAMGVAVGPAALPVAVAYTGAAVCCRLALAAVRKSGRQPAHADSWLMVAKGCSLFAVVMAVSAVAAASEVWLWMTVAGLAFVLRAVFSVRQWHHHATVTAVASAAKVAGAFGLSASRAAGKKLWAAVRDGLGGFFGRADRIGPSTPPAPARLTGRFIFTPFLVGIGVAAMAVGVAVALQIR
eukprot:TRINITY_DN33497_c0_g1_i1.p2 TRINITY_DN33497_c0_g1~~TRINITY_DN33497_c0_g1_i1.p2  ORF type:complete len:358 (+),score=37.86 TRINITY_DN33497_c0_g1_i1:133-1206(+)